MKIIVGRLEENKHNFQRSKIENHMVIRGDLKINFQFKYDRKFETCKIEVLF